MYDCIRIVSWGGHGDALLATPVFRALKEQRPERELIVYCSSESHYNIYLHNPHIDVLKPPGQRARLERWFLERALRIKFETPAYGLLHPSLFYSVGASHIIAEMFGIALAQENVQIFLTEREEEAARALIASCPAPVAIHPSAKCSPNKLWPMERWAELVGRNPEYTFVQLGDSADTLVPGAKDLRGISLRLAFGVVKWVRGFVGLDSVLAHATDAFGTPAVVLFGPSTPAVWGHGHNRNLHVKMPCTPCIEILASRSCPYGLSCMKAISVADVERELNELMSKAAELETPKAAGM